ncbi:MAG TPA: riboflavin synthase [Actinomycetota bacterium]|jgi:riboflavin synthase|nr:riboflavin synthase [Actinomycetota bacterium]
MFTGIVEGLGEVVSAGDARLSVRAPSVAGDAEVGASMAVNGVCLTVTDRDDDVLAFDLTAETLGRTTLGDVRPDDRVNVERPLTLASRLGGHLVQGHVDGVGEVVAAERAGDGATLRIRLPDGLSRFVAEKGSIAVDGVSLTVAAEEDGAFSVALVPHTLAATTLGDRRPGSKVNLEVDVLSKYVERLARRDG